MEPAPGGWGSGVEASSARAARGYRYRVLVREEGRGVAFSGVVGDLLQLLESMGRSERRFYCENSFGWGAWVDAGALAKLLKPRPLWRLARCHGRGVDLLVEVVGE